MTTTQVPTWHHPHFVSAESDGFGIMYQFRAFIGDEPEPELPESVRDAFRAASDAALTVRDADPSDSNREAASAILAAWRSAEREVRAANTMWRVARFNRDVTIMLRAIAPAVHAYQAARKAVVDTYESLHGTPDGFWQAKLLTLTGQRDAAIDAASKLDGAAARIAAMSDGLPERVLEETPSIGHLAKNCGADLGDWSPDSSDAYDYDDGPETRALERMFAEQDERIAKVTRLFGEGDR